MGRFLGTQWCDDRLCSVYKDSQSSDPHVQRVDYLNPICTRQDIPDGMGDEVADPGLEQLEDDDLVSCIGCGYVPQGFVGGSPSTA